MQLEIRILKRLRHPNIVQLLEVIDQRDSIYLVMEYIDGGELFERIKCKKRLSHIEASKHFQSLLAGISHCAQMGVVHRDIKPENLLIDRFGNLKICDFGLSNYSQNNQKLLTPCGSPNYSPPEMIKGEPYSGLESDLWSSGVVLFAMLAGTLPFDDAKTINLFSKILEAKFELPLKASQPARDLLSKLLVVNPKERLKVQEIRRHPFFTLHQPENRNFDLQNKQIWISDSLIDKVATLL